MWRSKDGNRYVRLWARFAKLLQSGAATTKAEGLWRRYLLGLTLMMCLILSANFANRVAIELGRVDGEVVQSVGELQMLSQRVLLLAKQMSFAGVDTENMAELSAALARFEELRLTVSGSPELSLELQNAMFAEPLNLDAEMSAFMKAGKDARTHLVGFMQHEPAMATLTQIAKFDLPAALEGFLAIYVNEARLATNNMKDLQTLILGVAIFVLILEALFVYLPAHLIVKNALSDLRRRATDLTSKKRELSHANRALNKAAKLDALTELPNRTYLIEILAKALKRKTDIFHVLYIDLDRFRAINDASGEATGDLLLKHTAQVLRTKSGESDLVARTGGDEFVIVTRGDPAVLAASLCANFQQPIQLAGRICQTGLCIGYSTRRPDQQDALSLLSNAELALKDAKSNGRNNMVEFSPALRAQIADRDLLVSEISSALEEQHIMPFYQPQVDLASGRLSGVEVLARWIHPMRGMIAPDDFLPLAAGEGLARALDYAVWDKAMGQLVRWRNAGLIVPHVSLNASPDTIADPQVVSHLLDRLRHHRLAPTDLAIEVLETTFIGSIFDMAAINIDRMIAAGITVELDDFGTGYTSLSTLIRLKLSAIKLDRSLIQPLPSPRAQSILRAVMALATEMKLHVVAEGIETPQQAEYLRDIGCQIGQGYGFGKPMTARDFREWAAKINHNIPQHLAQTARRA